VGALAVVGLVVPSAVGAHGSGAAVTQPLIATVGDVTTPEAFRITLTDSTGTKVSHLDPGTYTINVRDYATLHNFHLFGRGVQQATDIEGKTLTTWVVTFGNGTYRYQCDAHPLTMHGSFTSGTVSTPPVKKLVAKVGPRRTISLKTASGAKVRRVTAGRYRIAVADATTADNFHLLGPGVNKRTGIKFKGSVTWKVALRAGAYKYRSDAHRSLRGAFSVK
jgi:plastocyanin